MALAPTSLTEQPAPAPNPDPAANPSPDPAPAGADPAQKPTPPEGFGDALKPYFSEEKGAVDFAKLTEDVTALQAFKAEQDARLAGIPENLDDYEVALPEGVEAPEGYKFEVDPEDPAIPEARAFAKEHGLTKDGFKKLIGLKAKIDMAEHVKLQAASAAERTKLGTKAAERIAAVANELPAALGAVLGNPDKGKELAGALTPMMFTAASIEAFETLLKAAKGGGLKLVGGGREAVTPTEISDEDYNAMSLTQRIVRNTEIAAKRKTA